MSHCLVMILCNYPNSSSYTLKNLLYVNNTLIKFSIKNKLKTLISFAQGIIFISKLLWKREHSLDLASISASWIAPPTPFFFFLVHWGILFAHMYYIPRKEIPRFFPSYVFSSCFFMIHDACWGCQYNKTKLTGWEQVVRHFSRFWVAHQIWADDFTLV